VEHSQRARIRAGDATAFAELFDAHAGAVYRYAVRGSGDWAAAEDVVSPGRHGVAVARVDPTDGARLYGRDHPRGGRPGRSDVLTY
jgi:hypothetical protein